jgi:hypothetical protein
MSQGKEQKSGGLIPPLPGGETSAKSRLPKGDNISLGNQDLIKTKNDSPPESMVPSINMLKNPCDPIPTNNIIIQISAYLASFVGNDILRRIIPLNVENIGGKCPAPNAEEMISSAIDSIIGLISIYIVLSLLLKKSIFGEYRVYIIGGLILSFLIIPIILGTIIISIRKAYPTNKGELILRILSLIGSIIPVGFLIFIGIQIGIGLGFSGIITNILLTLFIGIPIAFMIISISKFLAPISILLLGPGIIPYLSGMSFLEFCS